MHTKQIIDQNELRSVFKAIVALCAWLYDAVIERRSLTQHSYSREILILSTTTFYVCTKLSLGKSQWVVLHRHGIHNYCSKEKEWFLKTSLDIFSFLWDFLLLSPTFNTFTIPALDTHWWWLSCHHFNVLIDNAQRFS